MENVLILGGTEFVGKALAKHLINKDCKVSILTRGIKKLDYEGINEHIIANRKVKDEMNFALKHRTYDYVFDISGYSKEDLEIAFSSINTESVKKYIFCSSGAVYEKSNLNLNENSKRGHNKDWGEYGIGKKEAEDFIMEQSVPYAIFRPTYIYGEENNLYREAYIFESILKNNVIKVPYVRATKVQFVYIGDLVKSFESAMKCNNKKGIYNITEEEKFSWKQWIDVCGQVINKAAKIEKVQRNEIEARKYFPFRDVTYLMDIDNLKMDKLFIPKTKLIDGLKLTYAWYTKINK